MRVHDCVYECVNDSVCVFLGVGTVSVLAGVCVCVYAYVTACLHSTVFVCVH